MIRTTYPNWVGASTIDGQDAAVEIRTYYAITRFCFKVHNSHEDWLLSEEGGRGFTLKLYSQGLSTEAIVNSFYGGADFYANVPYKESKEIDYTWKFPEPSHVFPVVTLKDVDFSSEKGSNINEALNLMEKFKSVITAAEPDPSFSRYYR